MIRSILAIFLGMLYSVAWAADASHPVFSCAADNDLYRVLADCGLNCPRYDTPAAAVAAAPNGGGVLLLADGYPRTTQAIGADVFALAGKKRLRLYVEYPASLPGLAIGPPRANVEQGTGYISPPQLKRGVIASRAFEPDLKSMRIVDIHGCHFVPTQAETPHLVLAKVAGFDTAVFGLPNKDVWPILFEQPSQKILVSTTKLSQFVTARYAPTDAWPAIWRMILGWVRPGLALPELKWDPVVRPTYTRDEPLPADAERQAMRRSSEWVLKSRMLIHPSWRGLSAKTCDQRFQLPAGDGSAGILEGFESNISHEGSQSVLWKLRTDCTGEQVAAFVLAGAILKEPKYVAIGKNLADFALFTFDAGAPWRSPEHPAFGLIGWGGGDPTKPQPHSDGFWGVCNARICLSAMAAATVLSDNRWDDRMLQVMLANFRTTGSNGFRGRGGYMTVKDLMKNGWRHYYTERNPDALSPHCAAQLLAANLAVYKATGYRPLLDRTRAGLRLLMEGYPEQWVSANGIQQDRARLILPLAWLVRIEDTAEHRAWLARMTGDFLKDQAPCGAVREELGRSFLWKEGTGIPRSNESYGTAEISLIQNNGEPVCDLLYTLNSGFLGLHEAAAATGNPTLRKAEDRMAQFLCRIQTRSARRPELDGTWFRAFDYDRWDYWGSNGDSGWGAWCVETGWVSGWLVTTLALRQMDTTLWDLAVQRPLSVHLDKNLKQLLPDETK